MKSKEQPKESAVDNVDNGICIIQVLADEQGVISIAVYIRDPSTVYYKMAIQAGLREAISMMGFGMWLDHSCGCSGRVKELPKFETRKP